jgi:hypothetical protein
VEFHCGIKDFFQKHLQITHLDRRRAEVMQTLHRRQFRRQCCATLGLGGLGLFHGLPQPHFRVLALCYVAGNRHRSDDIALGTSHRSRANLPVSELAGSRNANNLPLVVDDFAFQRSQRRRLFKGARRAVEAQHRKTGDDLLNGNALDRTMTERAQRCRVGIRISTLRIREVDLVMDAVQSREEPFLFRVEGFHQTLNLALSMISAGDIGTECGDGVGPNGKYTGHKLCGTES